MILISLEVSIKGNFPFVAETLDKFLNPLLLFWREWSFSTHVLIIRLWAMQVAGDSFAHRGIVFLHHTVVKVCEA